MQSFPFSFSLKSYSHIFLPLETKGKKWQTVLYEILQANHKLKHVYPNLKYQEPKNKYYLIRFQAQPNFKLILELCEVSSYVRYCIIESKTK